MQCLEILFRYRKILLRYGTDYAAKNGNSAFYCFASKKDLKGLNFTPKQKSVFNVSIIQILRESQAYFVVEDPQSVSVC